MPTSASRTNSAREVALLCLYILPVLSGRLLHTYVAQPPSLPLGRDQRVVHDLADLSPRRGVAGPERIIGVAGDDAPVVGCFDEGVERISRGHIYEVRAACGVQRPVLREHHYLRQLPARHVVTPLKGAVRVAGDDAPVVRCFYEDVEGIVGRHVGEVRPARGVNWPLLREYDDL